MASKSFATNMKRRRKKAAEGKKRKAALRTKGTTKSEKDLFGDK
jgi:hypothetical protein